MPNTTQILTLATDTKGSNSTYRVAGLNGSFVISKSMFDGAAPETIEVTMNFASAKTVKTALTPEQVAEKVAKQVAVAEKLRVRLAKLEAKLAPVAPVVEEPKTDDLAA